MPWDEYRGPNPFLFVTRVVSGSADERRELVGGFLSGSVPVLIEPLVKLLVPVGKLISPGVSLQTRVYVFLLILWSLAVWVAASGDFGFHMEMEISHPTKSSGHSPSPSPSPLPLLHPRHATHNTSPAAMADPLYELLVPYFDAHNVSPRPLPTDAAANAYLARLSTLPLAYCAAPSRSCKVPGTEMGSGVAVVANCVTTGQRMWNYDLGDPTSRVNRDRAESDRWYRVSFPDGRSGFLSEVYLTPASRGGLGLPDCGPLGAV